MHCNRFVIALPSLCHGYTIYLPFLCYRYALALQSLGDGVATDLIWRSYRFAVYVSQLFPPSLDSFTVDSNCCSSFTTM
jgi:hypothetical protein